MLNHTIRLLWLLLARPPWDCSRPVHVGVGLCLPSRHRRRFSAIIALSFLHKTGFSKRTAFTCLLSSALAIRRAHVVGIGDALVDSMYVRCLCEIMQCSHDVMLRQGVILIVVRSQNVSCRHVAALDVFFSRSSFSRSSFSRLSSELHRTASHCCRSCSAAHCSCQVTFLFLAWLGSASSLMKSLPSSTCMSARLT